MTATRERLAALGYEPADGGMRGTVLVPAGGEAHVVKLFPSDDLAYLSLLRYALDNPSPHLPRILHGPVESDDGGWAVFLERLEEIPDDREDALLDEAGGYLLDILNGDADGVATEIGDWGHPLEATLKETLLGIGRTLLRVHGFIPDESSGNILMRGDTPVVSDMVCGRNGRPYGGRTEPPFDPDLDALLRPTAPAP